MKPIERLDDFDSLFDLFLVLLGIITAAMFQHGCTITPMEIAVNNENATQLELFQLVNSELTKELRILFIPLVMLIGIWIFNRFYLKTKNRFRKGVSEFSYLLAFVILMYDVDVFLGLSFHSFVLPNVNPIVYISAAVQFFVSLGLVYSYEILFINTANIRTRKEAAKNVYFPIIIRTLLLWVITFILFAVILNFCIVT